MIVWLERVAGSRVMMLGLARTRAVAGRTSASRFQKVHHRYPQIVYIKRFVEYCGRIQTARRINGFHIAERGDQQDRHFVLPTSDGFQDLQSGQARHTDVGNQCRPGNNSLCGRFRPFEFLRVIASTR